MMLESVEPGRVYRNIKTGNEYYVSAIAKHSETEELMVVYCLHSDAQIWVRPLELFKQKFTEIPKSELPTAEEMAGILKDD